jgi:hypothetical protein
MPVGGEAGQQAALRIGVTSVSAIPMRVKMWPLVDGSALRISKGAATSSLSVASVEDAGTDAAVPQSI